VQGAGKAGAAAVKSALAQLGKARELLDRLIAVDPSVERLNLCGSLHRREAMIHAAAGAADAERAALTLMRERYLAARDLAASSSADIFYPMLNVLAAELAAAEGGRPRIPPKDFDAIRELLASRVASSPDFWSVVGQTELRMCEAVAAGSLAAARESLWREFSEHHQRVSAPRMWASVHDNATLILGRYARTHTGAEQKAASALLDALRQLTASTASTGGQTQV
jgi:hypothetical protein